MAYEETVIEGVLSWRDADKNDEWNQFSDEALSAMVLRIREYADILHDDLETERNNAAILREENAELRASPSAPTQPWPFHVPAAPLPPPAPWVPFPPIWAPSTGTPLPHPNIVTCGTPPVGTEYRGTPETWGHNPVLRSDGCDC
jgi:hypothetical protein